MLILGPVLETLPVTSPSPGGGQEFESPRAPGCFLGIFSFGEFCFDEQCNMANIFLRKYAFRGLNPEIWLINGNSPGIHRK